MKDEKTGLKFVIPGTGRNGTKYSAMLFTALGLRCGHEAIYDRGKIWPNPNKRKCHWAKYHPDLDEILALLCQYKDFDLETFHSRLFTMSEQPYIGDASWKATLFLSDFRGHIFHQVRHPLKVINSLYLVGSLWGWKEYQAIDLDCPLLLAAMRIYLRYNTICENAANRNNQYTRYQVEELSTIIAELCDKINEPRDPKLIETVLDNIPKNINSHTTKLAEPHPAGYEGMQVRVPEDVGGEIKKIDGTVKEIKDDGYMLVDISPQFGWDDLPGTKEKKKLKKMAERYGYALQSS